MDRERLARRTLYAILVAGNAFFFSMMVWSLAWGGGKMPAWWILPMGIVFSALGLHVLYFLDEDLRAIREARAKAGLEVESQTPGLAVLVGSAFLLFGLGMLVAGLIVVVRL